ncbi:MAG: hypothetical protein R3300_09780 [Candidatus Promineifilaceae bacterium]|nr:hypothetical protein [Candidatus Promineifilaceae bacterium]
MYGPTPRPSSTQRKAGAISHSLASAQRRLEQLRAAHRSADDHAAAPADARRTIQPQLAAASGAAKTPLPKHLGWDSAAVTAALHASPCASSKPTPPKLRPPERSALGARADTEPNTDPDPATAAITLHPSIATAMLRQGQAAPGRIWLLLRHIDRHGQGWLSLNEVRQRLTDPGEPLRVCGRRQLRNLLRQGGGIFWTRDRDRLWLRSAAKAAAALGTRRLRGRPVQLPLTALLEGMGAVRAHLYASFHSGRAAQAKQQISAPIARATLTEQTGVSRRTQHNYERRLGVSVRRNFAIGPRDEIQRRQEWAWRRGRAVFTFRDRLGRHGPPNQRYIAWQLPNSYGPIHHRASIGQQKRINRQLADLLTQGTTGNDGPAFDCRYYPNGARAAKAYQRQSVQLAYWPVAAETSAGDRLWQPLVGCPE